MYEGVDHSGEVGRAETSYVGSLGMAEESKEAGAPDLTKATPTAA